MFLIRNCSFGDRLLRNWMINVTRTKCVIITSFPFTMDSAASWLGRKPVVPMLVARLRKLAATIVNADDIIMTRLRSIKSPEEIACLREGLRLGEMALQAMVESVKPGMTELELTGIAVEALYRYGAECEAHTVYAFGDRFKASLPGQLPMTFCSWTGADG